MNQIDRANTDNLIEFTGTMYPAIKINQYNLSFSDDISKKIYTEAYITSLPFREILFRYKIDRWTPRNRKGYQRDPDMKRIQKSMMKYLYGEVGSYPTSVLLNVRKNEYINFKPKGLVTNNIEFGLLELDKKLYFFVVDGQHRIESLKEAYIYASLYLGSREATNILNYPLPVTILTLSKEMEMLYFFIVNSRQRKVTTTLSNRIIQRLEKAVKEEELSASEMNIIQELLNGIERWKAKAVDITDYLAFSEESPWSGRIKLLGYTGYYPVNERTFVSSLEGLLKQEFFINMDIETLSMYLIDYWKAIFEIYKNAYNYPREYTIMGYTGLFVFHYLFPIYYSIILNRYGNLSYNNFYKIVYLSLSSYTPEHEDEVFRGKIYEDYWHRKRGLPLFKATSKKLINELAGKIREKILLTFGESTYYNNITG